MCGTGLLGGGGWGGLCVQGVGNDCCTSLTVVLQGGKHQSLVIYSLTLAKTPLSLFFCLSLLQGVKTLNKKRRLARFPICPTRLFLHHSVSVSFYSNSLSRCTVSASLSPSIPLPLFHISHSHHLLPVFLLSLFPLFVFSPSRLLQPSRQVQQNGFEG